MALNATLVPPVHRLRFDAGEDAGADGGDGSGGAYAKPFLLFPAVRDDGGAVKACSYVTEILSAPLAALYAAPGLGFVSEPGFILNDGGVAVVSALLASTTYAGGPLPVGTAEQVTTLTKDGVTNVARWLVRLG